MPFNHSRRSRRTVPRYPFPFLFLLGFAVLLLAPVLDTIGVAQGVQITAQPTATPTEEFDPPLQARSTPTPTPRVTEEPDAPDAPDEIDDVQANPTAVPVTETVVDDFAPNPEPATLTLNKGVCDDLRFDPYAATGLDAFQQACFSPDGEFEFTVADGGGFSETATTSLGSVQFTVPTGAVTISETIPEGFGEPAVFCWSSLLPSPAAQPFIGNGPGWDVAEGEQVECWWFNVSASGGPDDLTTGNLQEGQVGNTVTVSKHRCPMGVVEDAELDDYQEICTQEHDDIEFTLTHIGGEFAGVTAGGQVQWTDVPIGDFTIQETVPAGFLDPLVWCGLTPSIQLPASVPAIGGLISGSFEGDASEYVCYVFNIQDTAPDSRVVVNKRICDPGVDLVLTDDNVINDMIVACPTFGEGIEFTLDHTEGSSTQAIDGDGDTYWDGVPNGPITITEEIPAGYGEPVWYCTTNPRDEDGDVQVSGVWTLGNAPGGVLSDSIDEPYGEIFACWVFNTPVEEDENSVTILKWHCPEGSGYDEDQGWYEDNCVEEHDGVEFRVVSDIGIAALETAGGSVEFDGLPTGAVSIQETIPEGFGEPVVFCAPDDSLWMPYDAPTGHWEYDFLDDGASETLVCHVYNIPGEPGSVTLLKWTCPPGYDLNAAGADPKIDCTEATDGIDFQFGLSGLGEEAVLQTTGEVIPGGVFFDDLEPDTYRATELVPEGIEEVFVLECTGHVMGVLQPYPLHVGNVLEIEIDAGEHLTCHWYNVPETEGGTLTVIKYTCTTETYVSEVDCQVYEGGKTFDLLHWNVDDGVWEVIDTEITDGVGQITWIELGAGDYTLDEHEGEWCHLTTLPVFGEGDAFYVYANEETIVSVYNCGGEPGQPGDTPTKYPNTGVPPGRGDRRHP